MLTSTQKGFFVVGPSAGSIINSVSQALASSRLKSCLRLLYSCVNKHEHCEETINDIHVLFTAHACLTMSKVTVDSDSVYVAHARKLIEDSCPLSSISCIICSKQG